MCKRSTLMSRVMVFLMVLAVMVTYSAVPMNQAFAASKKPAKVVVSSAKATSVSTVKLTWKKAKNAKKYQVYRATSKSGRYKKVATVKTRSYVNKRLAAGKTYYYKVRALNGTAKGKFSAIKTVTTYPKADARQVFVDAKYVKALKDSKKSNVVIAEVSWGGMEYAPKYCIPGAIHVNTDDLESNVQDGGAEYWDLRGFNNGYKELLNALASYGITTNTELVCYGKSGSDSAPTRLAMAALMAGVKNVRVLDGGVPTYGDVYPMSQKFATPKKAKSFGRTTVAHPEYVISTEDMLEKIKDDNFKLVSIRSYDEFVGTNSGYGYIDKAGEPAGAIWGHDTDDGSYLKDDGKVVDTDVLNSYLKDYGASTKDELAFYCGTGWRATIPFLICYEEGNDNMKLWDDGWYVYSGAYTDEWNGGNGDADAVKDRPVQIGDPAKGDVVMTTVGALEPKYCKLGALEANKKVVKAEGEGTLDDSNFTVKPGKKGVLNSVRFTSSDESIATVDAEGKVTVVDASKTANVTISAESNATCGGSPCNKASYTLVVNGEVSEKDPVLGEEKSRRMITNIDMSDTARYPKGKVVEVWVPIAQTDEVNGYQTASEPVINAPTAAEAKVTVEGVNGNKMVYLKWDKKADPAGRTATITYEATRYEVSRTDLEENEGAGFTDEALATLSEESRFVKVNDPIVKKYAARATKGKTGTLEKAYAIYEWVLDHLARIDNGEKVGKYYTFDIEGCGYGDTVKILEDYEAFGIAGGHCTDINSTFVALCRAAGIPAREMFGIRMNDDATGGQHCWAEFYLPGTGWVFADPGDVLKAVKPAVPKDKVIDKDAWEEAKASDKFAERKAYFWGTVDNNRIVVSNGRDVVLEPAQKADPRNTFGYPYAEVDGKTDPADSYRSVDAKGNYINCTDAGAFKYTIKCTEVTPDEPEEPNIKQFGDVTADLDNKTVTIKAVVNKAYVDEAKAVDHLVLNVDATNEAPFKTDAKALDMHDALTAIGAKPWSDSSKSLEAGQKLSDVEGDNADFSHLDVTVNGKPIAQCFKYVKDGVEADSADAFDLCFSGNRTNQEEWNTGCVSCAFSCFAGIVSNNAIGFNTANADQNYLYLDSSVLSGDEEVTIVYTLK